MPEPLSTSLALRAMAAASTRLLLLSLCVLAYTSPAWCQLPVYSNITIASYSKVFQGGSDCNLFWTYLGSSLAQISAFAYAGSWSCFVATGSSLPSIITLQINYNMNGMPTALTNNVAYFRSSSVWQNIMNILQVNCMGEAAYIDILQGTAPSALILAVTYQSTTSSILYPGRASDYQVNLGSCASPSPPSPQAPQSPPPSPPMSCIAQFSVRSDQPIPLVEPWTDNCQRLYNLSQVYFLSTNMNPYPLCFDQGYSTGTISFTFWIPSAAQFAALATQIQYNILPASIVQRGLGLNCLGSIVLSSPNCMLPSATASAANFPLVFQCASPSPPPPLPPSPPPSPSSPPPSPTPPSPLPPSPSPSPAPPSPAPATLSITLDFGSSKAVLAYTKLINCASLSVFTVVYFQGQGIPLPYASMLCAVNINAGQGRISLLNNLNGPDIAQATVNLFQNNTRLAEFLKATFLPCNVTISTYTSTTGDFKWLSCSGGSWPLCCIRPPAPKKGPHKPPTPPSHPPPDTPYISYDYCPPPPKQYKS